MGKHQTIVSTLPSSRAGDVKSYGLRTGPDRRRPGTLLAVLGFIACAVMLSGCGSRAVKREPVASDAAKGASAAAKGDWLCEAGKAANDWDCIQTENIEPILAERNARSKATPAENSDQQATLPDTEPNAIQDTPTGVAPLEQVPLPPNPVAVPQARQPLLDPAAASRPQRQATQPRPLTTALATDSPENSEVPAYARLAYRPPDPVRIIDLPENFYAAQLLAVSTKKQIEDFVVAQNLYNMSAARIERNGQIFYVLLLGVYETKDIALSAVAQMPSEIRSLKPWVRPIEGLQDAMMRADQLVATAGTR